MYQDSTTVPTYPRCVATCKTPKNPFHFQTKKTAPSTISQPVLCPTWDIGHPTSGNTEHASLPTRDNNKKVRLLFISFIHPTVAPSLVRYVPYNPVQHHLVHCNDARGPPEQYTDTATLPFQCFEIGII